MEQELVITKAKYINDRAYIPLTVMAANQQQKYIDLLTSKDAEVANKEMAEKLLEEYLPSVEKILKALKNNIGALRIAYTIEILHFKHEKKANMLIKAGCCSQLRAYQWHQCGR